jgi:hypothetical protein
MVAEFWRHWMDQRKKQRLLSRSETKGRCLPIGWIEVPKHTRNMSARLIRLGPERIVVLRCQNT